MNGYESGNEKGYMHKMVDDRLRHWYRGISNFSEVENQPNLLLCWIAGESAKIADQLDDEEVCIIVLFFVFNIIKLNNPLQLKAYKSFECHGRRSSKNAQ